MNLQPVKHHEPVTILMVPYDQYSSFPKAVDNLFKATTHPFKLIVVEGNAPEDVRHELEKRKKKHRNIQIIYSAHTPRMAEAFNLGLVHIRTRHAFLMHNQLLVRPGWLSGLIEHVKTRTGVLYPHVRGADGGPFALLHALLATRELLDEIGLFDESVGTPLLGIDLENRLKTKGVPVHRDPATVLEYQAPEALKKGPDRTFFQHQWDDPHAHRTLAYLKQKWGSAPEQSRYLEWLAKKRSVRHRPVFVLPLTNANGLKKFMQALRLA